jgi:hypothetical protein
VVEPVDPFQRGVLDGLKGSPRAASVDYFGLVEAIDGLGQGIVVAVADAAHRGLDAGLGQALGVLDGHILGGFNRSTQHLELGGCDEGTQTCFGLVYADQIRFSWEAPLWQRDNLCRFWRAIAAHSDGCSPLCSSTIRTARSRTSGENLLLVLLVITPSSQELEPPTNPGRFTWGRSGKVFVWLGGR